MLENTPTFLYIHELRLYPSQSICIIGPEELKEKLIQKIRNVIPKCIFVDKDNDELKTTLIYIHTSTNQHLTLEEEKSQVRADKYYHSVIGRYQTEIRYKEFFVLNGQEGILNLKVFMDTDEKNMLAM